MNEWDQLKQQLAADDERFGQQLRTMTDEQDKAFRSEFERLKRAADDADRAVTPPR